jgi:hypothetical protein
MTCKGVIMSKLHEVVKAIDTVAARNAESTDYEGTERQGKRSFTTTEVGKEMGATSRQAVGAVGALVKINKVTKFGNYLDSWYVINDDIESIQKEYQAGNLDSMFARNGTRRTSTNGASHIEEEEELFETVEFDALTEFKKLKPEDHVALFNHHIAELKAQVEFWESEALNHQNEAISANALLRARNEEILELKRQLMEKNNELNKTRMIATIPPPPVKTIVVQTNQPFQKQSGATQRIPGGMRIHGRPLGGLHAPSGVVNRVTSNVDVSYKKR